MRLESLADPCTDAEVHWTPCLQICPYLNMKPGNLPAVLLRTRTG